VDRDISLSLDPSPRPGVAAIAAPVPPAPTPPPDAAPPALDPSALPEPLWQALARHQLLLPLLRHDTVAAAVAGVALSDQERSQAQQAWAARHGIRSAEQLQAHLAAQALSEADAIWQAELPLRIQRHCEEHFVHRAEQRFLARKNQLDQVIYSLLRVDDASLARELYLRIAEGEADFAELAASYACGPEKATRGIVGPVPLLQAHPTLAEKLRTSRPGELQPPLQVEQWWLVLRLESMRPASFDDEMRRRMAQELFEEWVDQEVRAQLASRTAPTPPTP
jgi:parvulin-like peptidyl-prolyl isomerase